MNKQPTSDFAVDDDAVERDDLLYYRMAGRKRRTHGTWYRGGDANFHPVRASLSEPDAISRYIGHGWFPPSPFITKDKYIISFGSCFAAEVSRYFVREGYRVFGNDLGLDAFVIRCGEGLVSSSALRQQFEWAFGDWRPPNDAWRDERGNVLEPSEERRIRTRSIFEQTDIFIMTLGLSEVWFDKPTGMAFWRGIPKNEFDPSRHGFKSLSPNENFDNLRAIYNIIRTTRPGAEIIFTLSPVPLAATFRPVSCITANTVSKASLRIAIDQLMTTHDGDNRLHYFPSYEIVTSFLDDPYGDDLRHPRPETVAIVMEEFKRHYLAGDSREVESELHAAPLR